MGSEKIHNNNKRTKSSSKNETVDPQKLALKYKMFQQLFSEKDIKKNIDKKAILKKLRSNKDLKDSYHKYIKEIIDNPTTRVALPWDSYLRKASFWTLFWIPRSIKFTFLTLFILFIVNYIPGPSQHIVEFFLARAIYDTAPLKRLPDDLENYAHSAKIVDASGVPIKSYGKRNVTKEIPHKAKMAILACEDHYFLPHPNNPWYINAFFIHPGVSWFNLLGAVKDTLGGNPRGASTIVMQNAKKVLGNTSRTIGHKIEEIFIAYIMVAKFGKDKCLDFYLNTVPVGSNIYGFQTAAQNFFKKDISELDYQQLVTIGSFIPNHNRMLAFYAVSRGKSFKELSKTQLHHAKSAINKINLALKHLRDIGEVSAEQYSHWHLSDEESIRKIGLRNYRSPLYGEEQWTSWNVIKEVTSKSYQIDERTVTGSELLLDEKGDVIIETTVDVNFVDQIKKIINDYLNSDKFDQTIRRKNQENWRQDLSFYQKRGIAPPYYDFDGFMENLYKQINVGILMINEKGNIVAYVGGKEFWQDNKDIDSSIEDEKVSNNDRIIIDLMNKSARITPSSTIKPIISYYAMLNGNTDLQSTFADNPVEYKYVASAGKELWLPRNWYPYDREGSGMNRYRGKKYSLLEAQVLSVNTIFAQLYSHQNIREPMLLGFNKIGLSYDTEAAKYWPFGIGSSDVPVQQWLGIYNAFLDGKYKEPSFVNRITINNKVIYQRVDDFKYQPINLFDSKQEREQEMVALHEVCNRGTASGIKKEFKYYKHLISGKTGTAPNNTSALFVSHFNPYLDRDNAESETITMLVAITTNTGGVKSVGGSGEAPVNIAGHIYNYLFDQKLQKMIDDKINRAKINNIEFRSNYIYMANANQYMNKLLNEKCGSNYIYENIIGVDSYKEALDQILNTENEIYKGNDDLFGKLVEYYCDDSSEGKNKPGIISPFKKKIKTAQKPN